MNGFEAERHFSHRSRKCFFRFAGLSRWSFFWDAGRNCINSPCPSFVDLIPFSAGSGFPDGPSFALVGDIEPKEGMQVPPHSLFVPAKADLLSQTTLKANFQSATPLEPPDAPGLPSLSARPLVKARTIFFELVTFRLSICFQRASLHPFRFLWASPPNSSPRCTRLKTRTKASRTLFVFTPPSSNSASRPRFQPFT